MKASNGFAGIAVRATLAFWLLGVAGTATAAEPSLAGSAAIVAGAVSATGLNGAERLLNKGDAIYSGDRIRTGRASYVRLGLLDGGSMTLRPDTEFLVESFSFKPNEVVSPVKVVNAPTAPIAAPELQIGNQQASGNQAVFRLLRGGFRAVTGLVGKVRRDEYAVRVPVATIGIRGTVFFGVYCDAICAADPLVKAATPAGETAEGGLISGVDQGGIEVVSNSGQSALVESSRFTLTTASGSHVSLSGLPGFLGAETWLQAAQQTAGSLGGTAASTTSGAASAGAISNAAFNVLPVVGGIAAATAAAAAALSFNGDEGGNAAPTSTTR